ncbi:ATP-grasp domain-containing protein [Salisediminibacterium beveridgei]|uniref:Ribosomal protein S6 glutaminyl transferase n=1 Tax=Salisediminibacterium beveridgei TaxID=632773 RepID=A0A1D7QTP2_9BACI|nr:RimK family alpha-L-glutamate ligase [Salisediminibacterium beveridgei]AOM82345.1 Ribosomal protein S6 glutaminyl transferase [Salisediminibacterium beveridgei]
MHAAPKTLAILSNGHLNTEKFQDYNQWMIQAAETAGFEASPLTNLDVLASSAPDRLIPATNTFNALPDAVLFADKDLLLARAFEKRGVRVFNTSEAVGICDHKGLMHDVLSSHAVPTPLTIQAPFMYMPPKELDDRFLKAVVHHLGLPLVVKEAYGSFGEQVYLIQTEEALTRLTRELAGKPFLYQQYITHSHGRDMRVNVVGGRVVASMIRTSKSDFRANVTAGGQTVACEPPAEASALAIRAAEAVGADFAGVDLLFHNGGFLVCEVNTNPHIRSIYEATGIDIAPHMISWIDQHTVKTN